MYVWQYLDRQVVRIQRLHIDESALFTRTTETRLATDSTELRFWSKKSVVHSLSIHCGVANVLLRQPSS